MNNAKLLSRTREWSMADGKSKMHGSPGAFPDGKPSETTLLLIGFSSSHCL
jgi:hypothetical protein